MKRMHQIWRKSRVGRSILLTIVTFATGFAAGSLSQAHASAQTGAALSVTEQAFQPIWDAFSIIESSYIDPVDMDDLVGGAIKGMADALGDPHSGYIRPEHCPSSRNFSGEFSGIGVTVKTIEDTGQIEVVTVIPDTPADGSGVLPGDVFHQVDDIRVSGMTQAELSALVPGPPGTNVTIVFQRDDELVAFEIVRAVFEIPNIAMTSWETRSPTYQCWAFTTARVLSWSKHLKPSILTTPPGLIFDIRDNPGGTLASAIEIGSAFIEDGVLLRQVSRDHSEEVTRATGGFANIQVPIVVLVDQTSASASEVIAGAMQDHGVAAILAKQPLAKAPCKIFPPSFQMAAACASPCAAG